MARFNLDTWLTRRMEWGGAAPPTRDAVREWQLARLAELVAHAQENSPFYADHYAWIDPEAITSVEAFSRLPMLTADHLRQSPERLLCVSQDDIERIVTLHSSGTTGAPKRIFYTREDLEATSDFFAWGMSHLIGQGETALVLMPGDRPDGVGRLLVDALERTGAGAVAHGVMETSEAALEHCLDVQADCLVGSPSHVNLLAHAWQERGLPKGRIKSVLLCWDAVPDAVVRRVTDALGCKVYRHWGMIETGLGGAVDCAPGSGMHLREADVYLEIIDPGTGTLLPDGEFGEIVISTPLKTGMPIIRYRTGDRGRLLKGACACGSPMRRLDANIRRMDETDAGPRPAVDLIDLNEAMFAIPEVEDFVARLVGNRLEITACGHGDGLAKKIRQTLESLPILGVSKTTTVMHVDVILRPGGQPAIPGLGKRRILSNEEES